MRWSRLALLLVACGPTPVDSTSGATGESTGELTTDPGLPTTSTGATDPTGEATTGDVPIVACIVGPVSHDACPEPCPLSVDVEIACDDPRFAINGVRVAASPDVVWLATSGVRDSFLHAAGPDGTTRVELPAELVYQPILLATDPSGGLHVAATLSGTRDIVHLAEADDWRASPVTSQQTLLDLEVDLAGAPHVWSLADAGGYFEAVRAADTWDRTPALAPEMVLQTHFGLTPAGITAGVGTRMDDGGFQLASRVVDLSQDVGAPSQLFEYRLAPLAAADPPQDGPDVVFAKLHDDGLRVVWPGDTGLLVASTAPLAPMCPVMILNQVNCPTHCHDTAVGVERGAFMVARTGDGRGWLAHLTTHLDHEVTYTEKVGDVLGKVCDGVVSDDHGAGVLHVYELGFAGAQPIERLALPIATPAVRDMDYFDLLTTDIDRRPLDLRAFGSSLAIGLRTQDSATGVLAVRLLRLETAGI